MSIFKRGGWIGLILESNLPSWQSPRQIVRGAWKVDHDDYVKLARELAEDGQIRSSTFAFEFHANDAKGT